MSKREQIRLANWLYELWQQGARMSVEPEHDWHSARRWWQHVQSAYRRFQLAQAHGWMLCLPGLQKELVTALAGLAEVISRLHRLFLSSQTPELSQRYWHQEVMQLGDEFSSVNFDRKDGLLRVETPAITLERIELGPFAIEFRPDQTPPSLQHITIVALDPHPAQSNPDVIHPHVKDGELCLGDAKAPLMAALASGRLADAFLIIQSTLMNHNSHSAYVKLDQWNGSPCVDCSRVVSPDEGDSCHRCGNILCDQCSSVCQGCSSSFCPGCIRVCANCHADCCERCLGISEGNGDPLCPSCLTSCERCGKSLGREDLEEDLCPLCAQKHIPLEITQEVTHS